MTGHFVYSKEEVEPIVLNHHIKNIPPPEGMEWTIEYRGYGDVGVVLRPIKPPTDEQILPVVQDETTEVAKTETAKVSDAA